MGTVTIPIPKYFDFPHGILYQGDALDVLRTLPSSSVHCCITSPPYYGLRDYGTGSWVGGDSDCEHSCYNRPGDDKVLGAIVNGVRPDVNNNRCRLCGAVREDRQIGLEKTPDIYIARLVEVFREVKRVLRDDGTLWVNIGDSYAGGAGRWGGTKNMSGKQLSNSGSLEQIGKAKKWTHPIIKQKDLIGIPWMLAFALRADGWYLRSDLIWHKPNPMPESVRDRCTKSHEYLLYRSKRSASPK